MTDLDQLPDRDLKIGLLLALLQDDAKNQSSYLTWKEGRPQPEVATELRRDYLVSEERADKLSGAWAASAPRSDVPAGLSLRNEVVADLRRRHVAADVLPLLYACDGVVDAITVQS